MLLLGIAKYPLQSTKEAVKRMMEIPRLPEYIKSKGNYVYTNEEGVVNLVIYEFDSVKADEAIEQINNAYWRFYDVPGHRHQLIPQPSPRSFGSIGILVWSISQSTKYLPIFSLLFKNRLWI